MTPERVAGIARSQLQTLALLVVAIITTASPAAVWIYSIQQQQRQQGELLARVVQFVDAQTQAARAAGARERQRKEWCALGVLKPDRCHNLLTEAELDTLER